MKKNILRSVLFGSILLFTGCVQSVPAPKYTPPKSKTASSSISGKPLRISYDLWGDSTTTRFVYYHIYSGGKLAASGWLPGKKDIKNVFGTTQNIRILGTIGDKVVFVWSNGPGFSERLLSVYDFSENRTYHLLGNDEKFSILKRGNSYVLMTENKAISLNNIREIPKSSVRGYKKLSLGYYYSGLDNRGRVGKRYTEFTPDEADTYLRSGPDNFGKLEKLMFGANRHMSRAYMVR